MLSPDPRLIALVAVWTGLAAVCVALPSLWFAALVAAGLLALVALYDALTFARGALPTIERAVPERVRVGRTSTFSLRLHNPNDSVAEVAVAEELPSDLAAVAPEFDEVLLDAKETRLLHYDVVPRERGDRPLGVAAGLARSPLGLFRRRILSASGRVRVLPDASRFLRPEALELRRILGALGARSMPRRGDGTDFDSLRDYVPGDEPRRIDWRATGRFGRLVTRRVRREETHRVVVALDSSRLMGARGASSEEGPGRSKLDHCVDAGLALAYAALTTGDQAGLAVFDRDLHLKIAPRRRRADLGLFVEALAGVESRLVEPDYRRLVRGLLAAGGGRSLFVILTDFAAVPESEVLAPLALLAKRHLVLLCAVRDPIFSEAPEEGEGDVVYRRIALDDLRREREELLERIRRSGVRVLDLAHGEITAPVLNGYLEVRSQV